MTKVEKYKQYCSLNKVALFQQPEWLSIAAENYEILESNGKYLVLPQYKKMGLPVVRNAYASPYNYGITNTLNSFSLFPRLLPFEQDFWITPAEAVIIFGNKNVTTLRTQIITLDSEDRLIAEFNTNRKRELIAFEKEGSVITETNDADLVFSVLEKNMSTKELDFYIPKPIFIKLVEYSLQHTPSKLLLAVNAQKEVAAVMWLVIDGDMAYNLCCGSDYNISCKGAMTALQLKAMNIAYANGCTQYDFEGSSDDGVFNFYKSFGGETHYYARVTNSAQRISKKKK